jgi:hypothetical protein
VEVIQTGAIEAPQDVHKVIESNCSVKGPRLRLDVSLRLYHLPRVLLWIIAENIIEPTSIILRGKYLCCSTSTPPNMIILLLISTAECRYLGCGRIPLILLISYHVFDAIFIKKEIFTETEIVEVVHSVMTVPSPEDDHGMLNHNRAMTEPI